MKKQLLVFSIAVLSLTNCDKALLKEESSMVSLEENLRNPDFLDDGLEVSSLSNENIATVPIHSLVTRLHDEQPNRGIRSFLIARNNKLVFESYFNGWHRNRKQDLRSATKSFTSALMGIAIDKGMVSSVEENIFDYFKEYNNFENWDEQKLQINIADFLEMRTGLACDDWVSTSPGQEEKMYNSEDWVKFILDLPVKGNSGEYFSYCTGAPVVLGSIVSKATGKTIPAFAKENLFKPLGITDVSWEFMPNGKTDTGGHLHLYSRDMLKFGLLFLNDGAWKGKQLISKSWIDESTQVISILGDSNRGYGYLWWTYKFNVNGKEISSFFANGNGGQLIFVIPSLDAVIVFTGGNYNQNYLAPLLFALQKDILPAFN